jgi:translation initiation factor IF-2
MNITELARILKISPQELRDLLPELGFAIGQKAIKVDNNTAKKIIKNWPLWRRRFEHRKSLEAAKIKAEEVLPKEKLTIFVPPLITVRDFADKAQIPVNRVLTELMKNGVFTSINEKIDFDTAAIIGSDLNLEIKPLKDDKKQLDKDKDLESLDKIIKEEEKSNLIMRPPVIVVMGHVDHGKTKLLDSIRLTNVAEGESGGITQHIGAYQIERNNKTITFIDTPGHEAFTAMRSRGAKVADIAILVVAADDGVKQQTTEAFRIIEASKIPFIVAINKIDKEGADINKTKQELASQLNINPEDWGGKTICVPISAKENSGIEELLDMVLLVADTESKEMKANPNTKAAGTIIESNVDKGAGPVATILIQNGTLNLGDKLMFNNIFFGKVKALKNYLGESIKSAGPSTPVKILGLKVSPKVGDVLVVGEGKKLKMSRMKDSNAKTEMAFVNKEESEDKAAKLNVIIKSDFLGSAEAIEESLLKINTEKVKIKIIAKGLGNITEGDIKRAEGAKAKILGFNVKLLANIENLAREKNVDVQIFSIIYKLIEYIKEEMQTLVKPDINRITEGKIKVLAIFRTDNKFQIVGGKVISGQAKPNQKALVWRKEEPIMPGQIENLQAGKQEVKLVSTGEECGLKFVGKPIIEVGDEIEIYREEETFDKI